LEAILGEGASGLSATNIVRLKARWEADYKAFGQRISAKIATFTGGLTAATSMSGLTKTNLRTDYDRSYP
jgi:hypothetical protein